jgi:hypothetical protein
MAVNNAPALVPAKYDPTIRRSNSERRLLRGSSTAALLRLHIEPESDRPPRIPIASGINASSTRAVDITFNRA